MTRSFVSAGADGCLSADSTFYNPNAPETWDWGAGAFTKVVAETLKGLDFSYHGVDANGEAIAIAHHMVKGTPGITVRDISVPLDVSVEAEPASEPIPYGVVLRPENSMRFHLTSAKVFLQKMEGQAGLIYMDHGDSSEETARLHEADARIILERQLVKPGGLLLIDDHGLDEAGNTPKSKYSLPLFRKAGFRVLEEGYQILLERPMGPEREIPQILHRFPALDGAANCHGVPGVDYPWSLRGWEERVWNLETMDEFVETEADEYSEAYFQIKAPLRLNAGKMVVAAKLGGVILCECTPMPKDFENQISGLRLVFFPQRDTRINLLEEPQALSPRIFASTVNHPFWRGMAADWFSEDGDQRLALGSAFLTRRVRDSLRFLAEADQPKVLRLPTDGQQFHPSYARNALEASSFGGAWWACDHPRRGHGCQPWFGCCGQD